jgi:hypothetical protein
MNMFDKVADKRFDETFFCVEANSYEGQQIWLEFNQERGIPWISENGLLVEAGELDIIGVGKMPVTLSLFWNRIRGKLICFYEVSSRFVDHNMVEDWLKKNIIKDKTWAGNLPVVCDAMNACNILHAIQDSQVIWLKRDKKNTEPFSVKTPTDLAQFLFNTGEDEVEGFYKLSYGPPTHYEHESDLSCEDLQIILVGFWKTSTTL